MKNKLNAVLLFSIFIIFSSVVNAKIYKWVDENGVTHFGNQPPAQTDTKEIKENTGNSIQSEKVNTTSSRSERTSNQNGASKEEKLEALDCYAAVDNAKSSLKSLRQVGKEKRRRGDMDKEKYEEGVEKLKKASRSISRSDCEKSKGNKRKFYLCMSEGDGEATHAVICIMTHKFF